MGEYVYQRDMRHKVTELMLEEGRCCVLSRVLCLLTTASSQLLASVQLPPDWKISRWNQR